jgi:pyruvate-formate lyase-activating enzyme
MQFRLPSWLKAFRPLTVEPFLHWLTDSIYNPLTGKTLSETSPDRAHLLQCKLHGATSLSDEVRQRLKDEGWLVPDEGFKLAKRFRLRVATLEASTVCNQACYFCPVSTNRRETETMDMEFYERVVSQLAEYRETLEGVFMINYNEPTADPRFLEQVAVLKRYGLSPAVNSNGSGLTPRIVDALVEMGGLRFLSINLSTIDREQYKKDRGRDHLEKVLFNLTYAGTRKLADQMHIAVLGTGDTSHDAQYAGISEKFAGSFFEIKQYRLMNRAGKVAVGDSPLEEMSKLRGCDNLGSRPIEHVHISPRGECLLCCQDYSAEYVIGDLRTHSLTQVLQSDRAAVLRRQAYGLEEAPAEFICRKCTFALRERTPLAGSAVTAIQS